VLNEAYELLLSARRYHRSGDPRDAVEVGFRSAYLAIDLLMSFIPGPKSAGMARPALGNGLRKIHRLRMTPYDGLSRPEPPKVTQLKALERFKAKGVPEGAVALKGPGASGVYVKNGELFVADETHHYPLYRRDNERVLRLKNQQAPGQDELIINVPNLGSGYWALMRPSRWRGRVPLGLTPGVRQCR